MTLLKPVEKEDTRELIDVSGTPVTKLLFKANDI